jgi:serine/threonine-protein kinase
MVPGRPLVKRHTGNVEAYHLYLKGRHSLLRATPELLVKGKEYLEQAITLEPNYAVAYAGLAEFYLRAAFVGFMVPKEAFDKVRWAAMEALSRDETLAEAHSALGAVMGSGEFDWLGAEREFRRALELNPASSLVQAHFAVFFLRPTGRLEEAVWQAQQAVELDPLSASLNGELAYLYYLTGQHDLAIEQIRRTIEMDPSYFPPHLVLAITYGCIGRWDPAIAAAQKACELSGRSPIALGVLAREYGRAGRRGEAQTLLEELMARRRTAYALPVALVAAHLSLGDVQQAIEWAETGVEERDVLVVCGLKSDPGYADLRRHPHYQALLRKINLQD